MVILGVNLSEKGNIHVVIELGVFLPWIIMVGPNSKTWTSNPTMWLDVGAITS